MLFTGLFCRTSPWAGSSVKPSEGSDPSSCSLMWFIFGVSHKCGSGVWGRACGCARRACWPQVMPRQEHPSKSQVCVPGAVIWGVLVLVTKLIPKMTVKNHKRLPPCLFAFVGSDLLLICNTQASLAFWLAGVLSAWEPQQLQQSPSVLQCNELHLRKNPKGRKAVLWEAEFSARTCP